MARATQAAAFGVTFSGQQVRDRLKDGWQPVGGWLSIVPELVRLDLLIPTQWPHYGVCQFCQQRMGRSIEGDDPFPHVVKMAGGFYIWDGHTRIARWLHAEWTLGLVRACEAT